MSVVIIGGDHLGQIPEKLEKMGFDEILHCTGRKISSSRSFRLTEDLDLVIVLTNYINHSLMKIIKREAKSKCITLLFAKRSWVSIYKAMAQRDLSF